MVFSTVQISMPGTSCACVTADVSKQGSKASDATQAIRLIIRILVEMRLVAVKLLRDIDDTILKPHSRVEVSPGASRPKQGRQISICGAPGAS
jgi:hypothetical protein